MHLPVLNGNWVDLLIIIFLAIYSFEGWGRGFILGLFDVSGFILSIFSALILYPKASSILMANFSLSHGIANAIGFLSIAFIVELLFFIFVSHLYIFIDKKFISSKINTFLGFLPSLLSGVILLSFIITTLLIVPIRPNIKQDIVTSKIGGYLTEKTSGLDQNLSKIFGDAVSETLTFLTVKPGGNESVDLHFKTRDFTTDKVSESKMLSLVNTERINNNLKLLKQDESLAIVARAHCKDMFERGYFSHYTPDKLSPFDRMDQAKITYIVAGENLAYAPTVEIAHQGLMNSSGHRANILSIDFGKVGIGVINSGIYGRMFCQEFSN